MSRASLSPPESTASDEAFLAIPEVLISRATLLWVGFTVARADELWSHWTHWPAEKSFPRETDADDAEDCVMFLDYMLDEFLGPEDALDETDAAWTRCMDECGIDADTQTTIMAPYFKYLRLSHSCLYWLRDTVNLRHSELTQIQSASRDREIKLRRGQLRQGGSSGQATGASSSDQRKTQGQDQSPGIVGAGQAIATAQAEAAQNAPGYTTLYKGVHSSLLRGLLDDAGNLQSMKALRSGAPSDFSGYKGMYSWTVDYQVAMYYARFAKERARQGGGASIVKMTIPNVAIETLRAPDLQKVFFPNNEWKELIWHCRGDKVMPHHLMKYTKAILIIGTISRGPNKTFGDMSSPSMITEDNVLIMDRLPKGSPSPLPQRPYAVQYVFTGDQEGTQWQVEHGGHTIEIEEGV